jgi:hypothetical protein
MASKDRYGHTYYTKDGSCFEGKSNMPAEWVIESHYAENDGYTFARRGPEREVVININSEYFENAKEALDHIKNDNPEPSTTLEQTIIEIEKMIKRNKLHSKFFDPVQENI